MCNIIYQAHKSRDSYKIDFYQIRLGMKSGHDSRPPLMVTAIVLSFFPVTPSFPCSFNTSLRIFHRILVRIHWARTIWTNHASLFSQVFHFYPRLLWRRKCMQPPLEPAITKKVRLELVNINISKYTFYTWRITLGK